jgi:23S rRNA (pseudouridine1915-N3)-methyltransferase
MRIQVSAIGRLKPGPERELASHYVMRAGVSGRTLGITSIAIVEHAESSAVGERLRREEEGRRLLSGLSAGASVVAFDEGGRNLSSGEFAQMVKAELERGTSMLVFLIGGPDGVSDTVRESARGGILSLGRMTWPHRLARVMIAEQIYRAVTILINHPYHRG